MPRRRPDRDGRRERATVRRVSTGQWLIYTVETTPAGTRGPFGPITADDEQAAIAKASSMLNGLGLTVASVHPAPEEGTDGAGESADG